MHSCDDCVAVNCPSKSNVQLNAVYVHHFITMSSNISDTTTFSESTSDSWSTVLYTTTAPSYVSTWNTSASAVPPDAPWCDSTCIVIVAVVCAVVVVIVVVLIFACRRCCRDVETRQVVTLPRPEVIDLATSTSSPNRTISDPEQNQPRYTNATPSPTTSPIQTDAIYVNQLPKTTPVQKEPLYMNRPKNTPVQRDAIYTNYPNNLPTTTSQPRNTPMSRQSSHSDSDIYRNESELQMPKRSSVETMYPPEDNEEEARPVSRLPTPGNTYPARRNAPTPCQGPPSSPHDYINISSTTQRRYVNMDELIQDPVTQRARERFAADVKAAAADRDEDYQNM